MASRFMTDPHAMRDMAGRFEVHAQTVEDEARRMWGSRSSGGYLLDEPPDMTPSFPRTGVSGHAGAVQTATWERNLMALLLSL